ADASLNKGETQRGLSVGVNSIVSGNAQKQQPTVSAAEDVSSSEGGVKKNEDSARVEQNPSSSVPSNSSLKPDKAVSGKSDGQEPEAASGQTPVSQSSGENSSAPPASMSSQKPGSASGGSGIKFSIKPLNKSPLKPVAQSNPFSASAGKAAQKAPELTTSSTIPATGVGPTTLQSQSVSEMTEPSKSDLPDALRALMNDVMGGTEAPSSKMLIKKSQRSSATAADVKGNEEESKSKDPAENKEKENGDEIEKRKKEMTASADAMLEAQKRLEDEMEARRILDGLKKKAPAANSAEAEAKPAKPSVDPTPKPTSVPSIDELLDRLKKGGFQFPLQKSSDSNASSTLSSTSLPSAPLTSSSAGENSSASTSVSSSSSSSAAPSVSFPTASSSTTLSLSSNPSVPTYTAPSKSPFSSGNMSPFSSSHPSVTSSSMSPLLSCAQDVDLRIGTHPPQQQQQQPTPSTISVDPALSNTMGPINRSSDRITTRADNCGSPNTFIEDRDDRLLYHQDRDDRFHRPGRGQGPGPKHPLDPHAFPPLPGMYGGAPPRGPPRLPPPPGPDAPPSYQPTPRSVLPPKGRGRAQPPPPGTEFEKPAGVLGITDVDL
ncbi:hypothetical protein EGW08_004101, partial [Elysia chlorotica]